MEAKQKESFIHYFKSAGRHSAASWEAWPQHTQQWLGKTNTTTMNILPFSSIPWASTAEHIVIWSGVSLWSVHAGCPSCVPSQAHALFPPVHWDGMGWDGAGQSGHKRRSCWCANPLVIALSNSKNISGLSTLFQPKIQLYGLLYQQDQYSN